MNPSSWLPGPDTLGKIQSDLAFLHHLEEKLNATRSMDSRMSMTAKQVTQLCKLTGNSNGLSREKARRGRRYKQTTIKKHIMAGRDKCEQRLAALVTAKMKPADNSGDHPINRARNYITP